MEWNYSGPAEEKVEEIDAFIRKHPPDYTDEFRRTVRRMCHEAVEVDENCFPAYSLLGQIDWLDEDDDSMLEHYLKAVDRCDRPLDSELLIEHFIWDFYGEFSPRPPNWGLAAIVWERIQEKQPRLKTIRPIAIACRHTGYPTIAHKVMDDWQRKHPEDSVKLAKHALKYLEDPRKAADILERRPAEEPSDKSAERYLRRVNKRLERQT